MRSIIRVFLPVVALVLTAQGQAPVVINEVFFWLDAASPDAPKNHQWLELYNQTADAVDLTGWKVTARDGRAGASARDLPAVSLPAGGYLVVHFTSGENRLDFADGSGDYYTGDAGDGSYWEVTADEAGLYGPERMVDFVAWRFGSSTQAPGAAHDDAVAAGIWVAGDVLSPDLIQSSPSALAGGLEAGDSLGRGASSIDTDSPGDWASHGGESAAGMSPGRRNFDALPMRIVDDTEQAEAGGVVAAKGPRAAGPPAAGPRRRRWTVLLYLAGDAPDVEPFVYQTMKEVERAGGTDDSVNFVALYDGNARSVPARFRADGTVTSYPVGSTVRGRIGPETDPTQVTLVQFMNNEVSQGELDTGDPQTLKDFITWACDTFPADKYALVLTGHGKGWKGFGFDASSRGTRPGLVGGLTRLANQDSITMSEFSKALEGRFFELIAFESCLMGNIEVAAQLYPHTRYLVASEQVMRAGLFPHKEMAAALKAKPDLTGRELGQLIVKGFSNRNDAHLARTYKDNRGNPIRVPNMSTIALYDLDLLKPTLDALASWAKTLKQGVTYFRKKGSSGDNVQRLVARQSIEATRFIDMNFVDLYDFAQLVLDYSGAPVCAVGGAEAVMARLVAGSPGSMVLAQVQGEYRQLGGISIYLPILRARVEKRSPGFGFGQLSQLPYDLVDARETDGDSPLVVYRRNNDALPLAARDMETDEPLDPRTQWPAEENPEMLFHSATGGAWADFLERYYHPVSDNKIVKGVAPNGDVILPTTTGEAACSNGFDSIVVPVGSKVTLTADGSSDAEPYYDFFPARFIWDFDAKKPCAAPCIAPYEVPPGTDAAIGANDNMDADRMFLSTTYDQKDAMGRTVEFNCAVQGSFQQTLIAWDDDHMLKFHDTIPSARYVHPQSDSFGSLIECRDPVTRIAIQDGPKTLSVGDVAPFSAIPSSASAFGIPRYPIMMSVPTGQASVTVGGSEVRSGQTAQVLTDSIFGMLTMMVTPLAVGPLEVGFKAAGSNVSGKINLTVVAAPAVKAAQLTATAQPASLPTGSSSTLTVGLRTAGGQAVPNALVTLMTNPGSITFQSGTTFNSGAGTQATTDAAGNASIQARINGPGNSQVLVFGGGLQKTVDLVSTTVPANPGPATLVVDGGEPVLTVGQERVVRVSLVRAGLPYAGARATLTVTGGNVKLTGAAAGATAQTLTTDAKGVADFRITPASVLPVSVQIGVQGEGVGWLLLYGVRGP
ncbi:MAG: lamin tail domain-containing protein [Acidobacteria bacterium]|nr:lamin tail domain-containing protein [Acidobacteriota bacterium]